MRGRSAEPSPGLRHRSDAPSLPVGPAAKNNPSHAPSAARTVHCDRRRKGERTSRSVPLSPPGLRGRVAACQPRKSERCMGDSAEEVALSHLAGPGLAGPAWTSRELLEVLVNTVTHRRCPLAQCHHRSRVTTGPVSPPAPCLPQPHLPGAVGVGLRPPRRRRWGWGHSGVTPQPCRCHRGRFSATPCGCQVLSRCPLPQHLS